jgi:hypothetical protein
MPYQKNDLFHGWEGGCITGKAPAGIFSGTDKTTR